MKLEEEIKQSKFRNEYHKLAVNIFYTYSWLLNIQTKLFAEYKITGNQFNILRIIRGQHPHPASVNLLKDRMVDKMPDVSRLVERLRIKGFVRREPSNKDRRQVEVKITVKGLKLLDDMDRLDKHYEVSFNLLTLNEASILNELMDKMRG